MKVAPNSRRYFKSYYNGYNFHFFCPQRLYDKTFKANHRDFARMVAEKIADSEERLNINVFIATNSPLDKPFVILDRRDNKWIPNDYDYILSEVEE